MSSDESASTNVSTLSNRNDIRRELNVRNPEKWEMDVIGNFVLHLYHRLIITPNNGWRVDESKIRKEYSQHVSAELRQRLKAVNGADNIETLLRRCGFIFDRKRGCSFYTLKYKTLFDFRNDKIKELDNIKINSEGTSVKLSDSLLSNSMINSPIILEEDNLEIDEKQAKISLEYQGTTIQRRVQSFCPTNMSCYICQEDFSNMDTFEEHIQTHGDDSNFEFLNSLDKFDSPIFSMSYRLCKNSHNFCFELETSLENLIIERIIIVQSRSFFYVHNMRVPYKCLANGTNLFFVDSHLFSIHVEQPIVLICHLEDSKESRIVEQHHFMRSSEFPKVNFSVNPYRLPNKKTFIPKFQLADYFPPKEIQDALKDDFYYENLMKTSNEFRDYVRNGKNLQQQTIAASLNILLQIEDMDTIQQYLSLKQKNIQLRSYGDEYSFQLKSKQRIFLENILTVYDEVILTTRTDVFTKAEEIMQLILKNKSDIHRMKNTFVGLIQSVNTGRISFKCDQKIDIRGSYTVICRPSRLNLRYQYRSLQLLPTNMDFLKNFLFPAKIMPMPLSSISLSLYNKNINSEQLQAVRNISEGPRNDATYIIFGPPGTGKTTTLVESILQLLKKPETKVLVAASSNSACDEIALKLYKYLKQLDIRRGMVRIYSRSCEVRIDTIDDELLENSNMYNGQFYPDVGILHEYRIVVCTLSVVAKLCTGKFGYKEGHGAAVYTHLYIDEIAASMETEALLAITTILSPRSCLIIAGDHKQLGPILHSQRAKELGLDSSLMDRLLARDCYRVDVDTGDYDRTIQTRLVKNYRSHPAIVNLFSGLYYNHSLESMAELDDVSLCKIWHKSRNKQYPILFHAIYEPSKSDNQSHSLYNLRELCTVMDYVKDLMYFGINGEPVKESDIGIISPYKKQYKRIQEELNLRKWFGIETGSVETFQGKEKSIIIVSFVRSGTENLGFLDNPRRLNVTISRPKSLLILIGNPKTLSLNSDFEYIIKECHRNNTFVGPNGPSRGSTENLPNSQEKVSQLNKNMQTLSVENIDEMKNCRRNRRGFRGGKTFKSKNNESSNLKSAVDRDIDSKDEDDDDNKSQVKGNNKSKGQQQSPNDISHTNRRRGHSKGRNNFRSKNTDKSNANNLRAAHDMQKSKKSLAANGGKISKQRGKVEQKNLTDKNLGKPQIDSIFNELPKVPTASTKPKERYTHDQLLELRQQQHNFQQTQQLYHNSNHSYLNSPTAPHYFRQPAPVCNPIKTQQQQNVNSLASQPALNYTSPFSLPHNLIRDNNANLSSYKTEQNDPVTGSTYRIGRNIQTSTEKSSTVTAADIPKNYKNNNTNSIMTSNSASIANLQSLVTGANKKIEQPTIVCTSGAANLVSKDKTTTNSGKTTTAITSNNRGHGPQGNLYPVVRDPIRTFSTNTGDNVNYSASSSNAVRPSNSLYSHTYSKLTPNVNSSANSSHAVRPSSSTTINSSLYSHATSKATPNSNVSTSSNISNSISTNINYSNNTFSNNRPTAYNSRRESPIKKKQENACVVS